MYPAAFDYVAPRTVEETLGILADGGEDVKVLAGGQSLIPLMKLRLASPATLVDINRVPGLDPIDVTDGHLRAGTSARHNAIARSAAVATENHTMAAAAPWISDPLVRNLGTIGGSVAHADPQGDWGSAMLACGGEMVARSANGQRTVAANDFFVDLFTSALEPDELLTEIHVPRYQGPAGGTYLKLMRKVGDYDGRRRHPPANRCGQGAHRAGGYRADRRRARRTSRPSTPSRSSSVRLRATTCSPRPPSLRQRRPNPAPMSGARPTTSDPW